MADDEQSLTKRERQKQRKQAKREAERAAQRRQRVRKLVATAVVAVLALAAIGGAAFLWQQSRSEQGELLAGNADAAQAAGCEPVEQPPDLGRGHFSGQSEELAQSPPSQVYDHRPATTGSHLPVVAATGAYDQHVDERLLLHNLEHGYIVAWFSPELGEERRAEMLEWGESTVADEPYLIVAEYPEPLPDGGAVGYVAWKHRQLCDDFDPQVADAFVDRFANTEQPADELNAGPHDGTGQGELVPGEDPVVFPPFEEAGSGGETEDEADGDGTDSGDGDGTDSGDGDGGASGDGDGAAEGDTDN